MLKLTDIVAQRPIAEAPEDAPGCPRCESRAVDCKGTASTLMGFGNHVWQSMACKDCGLFFTREYKEGGTVWYTVQMDGAARVLRGMPACFESYLYDCAKCGGPVGRSRLQLDSDEPVTVLVERFDGVKLHRVVYACVACGHGGEVGFDYHGGPPNPRPKRERPMTRKLNVKWSAEVDPDQLQGFVTVEALDELTKDQLWEKFAAATQTPIEMLRPNADPETDAAFARWLKERAEG